MAKKIKKMILNGEAYDLATPVATSSVAWSVKLGSDTVQSTAANAVSSTASRSYALQVNSSWQWVVNVPWTDTTYSATDFDIKDLTDSTSLRTTWSNKQDALSEVTKSDMDTWTSTTAWKVSAKSIADYVKWKVANTYVYKGTKATYGDLPASWNVTWDVWNVTAAHTTDPKFPAWSNVAWDWEAWDVLWWVFDTSSFVDTSTNQTVWGTKTFTTSPVVPSKTAAATNTWTAIATEAQVYTVAQAVSTLDWNVVKLSWNQTVAWTKTFSTSPVVPSKTSDATNSWTAIATEAQVYKKLDSSSLWNATITFKQGIDSTAIGTLTTNQSSNGTITMHDNVPITQADYDNLPTTKATDWNAYWIYEIVS